MKFSNSIHLEIAILLITISVSSCDLPQKDVAKNETKEEIEMVSSKFSKETFDKMLGLFRSDIEEKRFEKIDENIQQQNYSALELNAFKKEIYEVFLSDNHFSMLEKRLDWTLDNILY